MTFHSGFFTTTHCNCKFTHLDHNMLMLLLSHTTHDLLQKFDVKRIVKTMTLTVL